MNDTGTTADAEAFADFLSFGFRASDDPHEPGHLDGVTGCILGVLSRNGRDAFDLDRTKPRLCAKLMRQEAERFPPAPVGRPGSEVASLGKLFLAVAELFDMRARVRQSGHSAFDVAEAGRLRRVASSNMSIAVAERARVQRATSN